MSMITEYVRLRPDELARFRQPLAEDSFEAFEYVEDLRLGDEDEEVSSRGMEGRLALEIELGADPLLQGSHP